MNYRQMCARFCGHVTWKSNIPFYMYSIILLCSNVLTMQSISLLQMQTEQAVLEDYSLKTIEQPSVLLGQ